MTGRHAATAPMYQLYRQSVNFKRLYSHTLGGKAIIWSCRRRSTLVSPYNAVGNDAASTASQLLEHSLPQAAPSVPTPRRRRRLSPLHSMSRSRASGALYIVNKMCVHNLFGIFPRGTKDTCSQLSRHWSVTGQSSINRSRTLGSIRAKRSVNRLTVNKPNS